MEITDSLRFLYASHPIVVAAADEIDRLRSALTLAEDVLGRFPYSAEIWPNGVHPQEGMTQIRGALGRG